ncbi:MAG: putative lipid II flippase FtsW [Aquabacterium sp.]|jgi:cell division protein FtsW|nr:MAG: putative lipid II flippase FtsW [Aquabacterium sp.]
MISMRLPRPDWRSLLDRARALFGRGPSQGKAVPVRDWVDVGGQPTRWVGFDQTLVWVVVAVLMLGLVMVYSASIQLPDGQRRFSAYAPTHFMSRHAFSIVLGAIAFVATARIPIAFWERWAPWIFVASIVLLIMVLIPGVGKVVYKSRRWIPLGVMNFQPSELAKLAIAFYAASYMVRKMDIKEDFLRSVLPMAAALAVLGMLLLAEPDMGAFVVIAAIAMGILFLGGVNGRMFLLSTTVLLMAFVTMIATSAERRGRILAFMRPFDPENELRDGFQLSHSLIAFGRGGIFGQGLGASVEKLHYLPEAHTDFMLAVIGEELGLVAVLAVIVAFLWIVHRVFVIGRQAVLLDRVFAGLAAQGVGIWFGVQSFINMGVNLGVLPTKGLTLPLMSYGGSAILLNLIALAVVVRVDIENRQLMRGGRA